MLINITNFSNQYGLDKQVILIPVGDNHVDYEYQLTTSVPIVSISSIECYLVNSKTGYKYTLQSSYSTYESEIYIYFYTTAMSNENSYIDYLEFKINTLSKSYYTRQIVAINNIRSNSRAFKYEEGSKVLADSNLLISRNKFGFAKWSSAFRNQLSNASKIIEPLHSVFNSSIYKINKLYNEGFGEPDTDEYEEVVLAGKPEGITRNTGDSLNVRESDCIQSGILSTTLDYLGDDISLISIIVDPYDDDSELLSINEYLPCKLYFKSKIDREDLLDKITIIGYDQYNNLISESISLRRNIYTMNTLDFYKIVKVESSNGYEISNYVDCRYSHSVITNKMIPPVVDKDGTMFCPTYLVNSNEEGTNIKLVLNNDAKNSKDDLIFDFNDNSVRSVFIDNNLNIFYTSNTEGAEFLNVSKLSIDLTKTNYNDTSINASELLTVSNTNTVIGDWIEAYISVGAWFDTYTKDVCYITCKTADKTYYFDQEQEILVEDKILFYKELMTNRVLELFVKVTTSDPYVFSITDEIGKNNVSALSHSNELVVYNKLDIEDFNSLIHYNNKLYLSRISDYTYSTNEDNFDLIIEILPKNNTGLNLLLKIGDYFISNKESNMPSYIYHKIESPSSNHPLIYYFDVKSLRKIYNNELNVRIEASWDSIFYNPSLDNNIEIKIYKSAEILNTDYITPEINSNPTILDYTIDIGTV